MYNANWYGTTPCMARITCHLHSSSDFCFLFSVVVLIVLITIVSAVVALVLVATVVAMVVGSFVKQ